MGFLTSSFQSIMLTRLISQENNKVKDCMSRLKMVKKEYSRVEKQISNELKANQTEIRNQYSRQIGNIGSSVLQALQSQGIDTSDISNNASAMMNYNNEYAKQNSLLQTQMQSALSQAEQAAEDAKTLYLEPLKDEQDDIEVEKEEAESNAKLYSEWKQAAKEDVQNSVKNLRPQFSGSNA